MPKRIPFKSASARGALLGVTVLALFFSATLVVVASEAKYEVFNVPASQILASPKLLVAPVSVIQDKRPQGLHRYSSKTGRETGDWHAFVQTVRKELIQKLGADAVLVAFFDQGEPQPFWKDYITWDGCADELDSGDAEKLVKKGYIEDQGEIPILSLSLSLLGDNGALLLNEAIGYGVIMDIRADAKPGDAQPWDFKRAFSDEKDQRKRREQNLKASAVLFSKLVQGRPPKD